MGKTHVWRCTCCVQATSGLPENFDRMFVRPLGVPFHARNITTREGRGVPPRSKYISAKLTVVSYTGATKKYRTVKNHG
jgi:heterodisulfide reductase subunit C